MLQERHHLAYHSLQVLSNHLHLLLTDRRGDQIQSFNRDFFSHMAKSLNCYRGRKEHFWNSDKPSCVIVAPRAADLIDKSAYIQVNCVESGLVSHAKKWPGVKVLASQLDRFTIPVKRPDFYYSPTGSLPKEVEVSFTLPKAWDATPQELRRSIEQECNRREQAVRDRMKEAGKKFKGAKNIRRQSVHSSAQSRESWFELNPHVACKDTSLRVRFLQWRARRQRRYEERRAALLEGVRDVVFPEGTYAQHFLHGCAREEWRG